MFRDPSDVPGDVVCSAQTLAAAAFEAIGKIRTASGSVTVMRADGEIVRVSVGDLVYRGDTIETDADGAVGITFADGTAFDLSAAARLVLNEFVCDPAGTPNSALFSLVQGAFAFVAGKIAKTGGLRIDTPFASIRGSAQDRGVGVLTLAALTFAAIKESEAASRHDAFLDDGTITYKDLPHGTFEIVTRDGRVIMADDPGETIVVDPTGSVTRLPEFGFADGGTATGPADRACDLFAGPARRRGGRIELTAFRYSGAAPSDQFCPASFNGPTPEAVTTRILLPSVQGFIKSPKLNPPLVTIVTPVLASAGISRSHRNRQHHRQHACRHRPLRHAHLHRLEVTTVSASLASMTWSGGATLPSGLAEVLAGALSITTESANPVFWVDRHHVQRCRPHFRFSRCQRDAHHRLQRDGHRQRRVSLTQPVTITVTGTNDAPALAADASGPHTVTQGLITTGTLTFTDVDLTTTTR